MQSRFRHCYVLLDRVLSFHVINGRPLRHFRMIPKVPCKFLANLIASFAVRHGERPFVTNALRFDVLDCHLQPTAAVGGNFPVTTVEISIMSN